MNTKIKKYLFLFLLIAVFAMPALAFAAGNFDYTPMEKIPGLPSNSGDFVQYILAIYKFGIWTIGIAALLMIMIGGYMYITSAGNNAAMQKAKSYIADAIIGIIMALTAYLLLYVINPELTKIKTISLSGTSFQDQSACKKWCTDAGGDADWTSKCTAGCGTGIVDPNAANRAACEQWCRDANGNADWTAKCITGCGSGTTASTAKCSNLNSNLNSDLANASSNGVPPALLASFMQRECTPAMSNASACGSNNLYGAGGPMQFIDSTWKQYGCSGNKFNRQDSLACAAKKIRADCGGDYSEAGIKKAAKAYCGSCTDINACGGNYCDGILANYNIFKTCSL